ncbi:MAG: hypothetical protein J6B23_10065 [Clostridia bacterium]|nr:hypothetical protein [Clostridia bacterium]
MLKLKITSLFCAIMMVFTMFGAFGGTAFADALALELVAYEDFESYDGTVTDSWTFRNTAGTVTETEKGQSLLVEATTAGSAEVFKEWTAPAATVRDFTATFSMKFADFNGDRRVYTKNANGEYDIFSITTSGKLSIAGVESEEIILATDTWYNFETNYDAVTGYVEINVTNEADSTNSTVSGYSNCNGHTGLSRLDFVFSKLSEGTSVTYLDDIEMYGFENESEYLIPIYDFEDYKVGYSFKNNQSAQHMPYWTYQNAIKNLKIAETEKGKSVFMEPNGWTSLLYGNTNWKVEDSIETKFSINIVSMNQFVRVCMHNQSSSNRTIPLEICANGTVKVFDKQFTAADFMVEPGIWYDVSIKYGKASRALVTISGNGKTAMLYSTTNYLPDVTQIAFLSGAGASFYLDNIEMKKIDKTEIDEALGAQPTSAFIPADNFESYATDYAFPRNQTAQNLPNWTYQNDIKNAKVAATDKGNSAFIEPNGWTSLMYGDSNWILADSLELKYSLKVSSLNQFIRNCMIYLNDSNRVIPFEISTDGSVKVFDKSFESSDFRVQTDVWYDISLKFAKNGKALVTISGNGEKAEFYGEGASIPDLTRITFLSGAGAAFYIDDIEMNAIDSFTNTLTVSKDAVEAGDVTASIFAPEIGDNAKFLVIRVINEDTKALEDVDIKVLGSSDTESISSATVTVPVEGNYSVKAMLWDYNFKPLQHISLDK